MKFYGAYIRNIIEILIIIWYGDRRRTHDEVCVLFNVKHPHRNLTIRSCATKIYSKFGPSGHVKNLPKSGLPIDGSDLYHSHADNSN